MRSRLVAEQVREMRQRAADGESDVSLGERFGVERHTVVAIRMGTRWRGAGGPLTRRNPPPMPKPQRARIRRALERGETQMTIAEREGCALSRVVAVAHPIVGARRIQRLEREVASLRAEVNALRAALEAAGVS